MTNRIGSGHEHRSISEIAVAVFELRGGGTGTDGKGFLEDTGLFSEFWFENEEGKSRHGCFIRQQTADPFRDLHGLKLERDREKYRGNLHKLTFEGKIA